MNINSVLPYLIIAVVVLLAIVIAWMIIARIRSQRLQAKFGPEYDYTIEKVGDRTKAETDLIERQKRIEHLNIHPLSDKDRDRYHTEWLEIQAGFVDEPKKSVELANRLITEVMISRGFPVVDFEQRAADLSVLYPDFVINYRNANAIAQKNQFGEVTTEELRQAMIDYRSLFDELLGTNQTEQEKETEMAK